MNAFEKLFNDHEALDVFISENSNTGTNVKRLRELAHNGRVGCNDLPTFWLRRFVEAIRAEVDELAESIPWKWWRSEKTDIQNVHIELIDIFHFLMSAAAASGMTGKDFISLYYQKRKLNFDRQIVGFKKDDNRKLKI